MARNCADAEMRLVSRLSTESTTELGLDRIETFEDMNLNEDLLASVLYDFKQPTLVQKRSIKACIEERDVIVDAPSGTGKTTLAAICILQQIKLNVDECQAIILVPTMENAIKTAEIVLSLGDFSPHFKCHITDQDCSMANEIKRYEQGVHVIIGTPESVLRLFTQSQSSKIDTDNIELVVLDDANLLLEEPNKEHVYSLLKMHLTWYSQIIMLSTNYPKDLDKFVDDFMNESVRVILKKDDFFSLEGVRQFYVDFQKEEIKFDCLLKFCNSLPNIRLTIFSNTRRTVDLLAEQLKKAGLDNLKMHISSCHREEIMEKFSSKHRILITTDYLSKGFKLPKSLIVNYDLPEKPSSYGERLCVDFSDQWRPTVISFVTENTRNYITNIEGFYNTTIEELPKEYSFLSKDAPVIAAECNGIENNERSLLADFSSEIRNGDSAVNKNGSVDSSGKDIILKLKVLPASVRIEAIDKYDRMETEMGNSKDSHEMTNNISRSSVHSEFKYSFDNNFHSNNGGLPRINNYDLIVDRNAETIRNFHDVNLHSGLKKVLVSNFQNPLVIQQRALVPCIEGYDTILEAPAGSGKTSTIVIVALQLLSSDSTNRSRVVIIVPNFDNVDKVQQSVLNLCRYLPSMKCYAQFSANKFASKFIPTDSRLIITTLEHIYTISRNNALNLENVSMLAFDEADEIFHHTFEGQIKEIFQRLPGEAQIILSTRLPAELSLIRPFSKDFVLISLSQEDIILSDVQQFYVVSQKQTKFDALQRILTLIVDESESPVLIYCNTYRELRDLLCRLKVVVPTAALKTDLNSKKFEKFANKFKEEGKRALITLDQFSKSINFDRVPYIVNYCLPVRSSNYLCRIVRNGTSNNGVCKVINLVTENDKSQLEELKKSYKTDIICLTEPYSEALIS